MKLPKALNNTQERFAELCAKGGGVKGGPARSKVQELLRQSGQQVNTQHAEPDIAHALTLCSGASPWHVCFAMGLCWGHLAKLNDSYMAAAVGYLEMGSHGDLAAASAQFNERGSDPIEQSLLGGRNLFGRVTLPTALPATLDGMRRAQDRWLSPILSATRPRYVGSWNATAIFMIALFAQPKLGDQLIEASVMLPPGGPIFNALTLLHKAGILPVGPEGSELDDEAFEPGSIFANTGLMADIRRGRDDWDLLDVHSGLYMLGTRDAASASWFADT